MPAPTMEKVVNLCKRRGFVYPGSEIYGGLGSSLDYGPLGVELKRNVKEAWWREIVTRRDDVVGLDAAIIMHPGVGGLRPPGRLHGPARRLQGLQAALSRRPGRGRTL